MDGDSHLMKLQKLMAQQRRHVGDFLLWRAEFDKKVGVLSLRPQLVLRGRVGWR